MLPSRAVPPLLALPLLVLGCATSRPFDRSTEPGGKPLPPTTAGSVILTGEALSADPGRTVLDAIRRAMPQLHISGWSQYNRCPVVELRGHGDVIADATFSPDGGRAATASYDGTVRIWDIASWQKSVLVGYRATYSPDGAQIAPVAPSEVPVRSVSTEYGHRDVAIQ